MNRLQDQFRYLLQNITERNLMEQENKETNKKDFDQSNSRICEPQDVKGIKCENPQITKNKTSSSSSSHDNEGNEETYRNNIYKINSNNNLEILDDNSKAELDVQNTHRHFAPGHYEQKIFEETTMPVRHVDISQKPAFNQVTNRMSKQKNVPQTANLSIWGKIYNFRTKNIN